MQTRKQIWLEKRATVNQRGNFEFAGDSGRDNIVVEIDPEIIVAGRQGESGRSVVAMHGRIQRAAQRKYRAGEAYPVYESYSSYLEHRLIALTPSDLIDD